MGVSVIRMALLQLITELVFAMRSLLLRDGPGLDPYTGYTFISVVCILL